MKSLTPKGRNAASGLAAQNHMAIQIDSVCPSRVQLPDIRASHQPELRRALEEGASARRRRPPSFTREGGIPQPDRVRIRAWAEVAAH